MLMGQIIMQDDAPPEKVRTELSVYLPDEGHPLDRQALVNTAGEFLEALGFELDAQEETNKTKP